MTAKIELPQKAVDRLAKAKRCVESVYYSGDPSVLNAPGIIAVIGRRDADDVEMKEAYNIGMLAAKQGYIVLNGLAHGIDTASLQGALSVGGKTIVVMPCGLDVVYPEDNRDLEQDIIDKGGCVVSEYPDGFGVRSYTFKERDAIQASLSEQLVVVSSGLSGGTMHTVAYAKAMGVPIQCVLGDSPSAGCEMLISKHIAGEYRGTLSIESSEQLSMF